MSSLFVDQLTVIDFSYLHPVRGIVGESWLVDITLSGDLNDEGMVFDFGLVKKQIKQAIDEGVDHKFLIPANLTGLEITEDSEETFRFTFNNHKGIELDYSSPREAVYLVESNTITIDILTPIISKHIKSILPSNVTGIDMTLYTEEITDAYYHYSHGLKKHQGDCQRICHGHRSRIEIWRNESRDFELEKSIASSWQDIYLITEEDIVKRDAERITLKYQAEQGEFALTLPSQLCDILTTDTTVELIAQHLASRLKSEYPNDSFRIKAFEGFKKGALAYS